MIKIFPFEQSSQIIDWQALLRKGLLAGLMYSCFVGTAISQTGKDIESVGFLANYSSDDIKLLAQNCKSTGDIVQFESKSVLCISNKISLMKDFNWEILETKNLILLL